MAKGNADIRQIVNYCMHAHVVQLCHVILSNYYNVTIPVMVIYTYVHKLINAYFT